ncbi:MAG: hypothetical protein WBA57_23610 [Elainellaceae cyanobacterium]
MSFDSETPKTAQSQRYYPTKKPDPTEITAMEAVWNNAGCWKTMHRFLKKSDLTTSQALIVFSLCLLQSFFGGLGKRRILTLTTLLEMKICIFDTVTLFEVS